MLLCAELVDFNIKQLVSSPHKLHITPPNTKTCNWTNNISILLLLILPVCEFVIIQQSRLNCFQGIKSVFYHGLCTVADFWLGLEIFSSRLSSCSVYTSCERCRFWRRRWLKSYFNFTNQTLYFLTHYAWKYMKMLWFKWVDICVISRGEN